MTAQRKNTMDECTPHEQELLSAFLDNEVTPEERDRARVLLATKPSARQYYFQQLKLRAALRKLPVPPTQAISHRTLEGSVFARVGRQRRLLWGGSAVAAALVGIFTWASGTQLQLARTPGPLQRDALDIAIHQPVLALPELEAAAPTDVR